jgi:hypothetical protein
METSTSNRVFYQALIQLAAGMYHLCIRTLNGACSQLSNLRNSSSMFAGIAGSTQRCWWHLYEKVLVKPDVFSRADFRHWMSRQSHSCSCVKTGVTTD